MSDTLTPSGLQSSAGLYGQCGVYQFDRNGAIFNPLDLNPYLLFDAETSMIGTLENPTLDLDPSKQETLDVITATRSGSATFVNISGEIETAQANTVRVDHSLGYPAILIEPSATNFLTYSEDFSQGSWTKDRATLIGNSITSPDGSLNASKLVESATTGTHLTWTQATTTAATHSFSVFAKAGERKRIGLRDNQIGNSAVFDLESGSVISGSGGSIAQAANGFFRITLTGTYAAAGTRHEIYVLPDNATTANTSYTGDGTSGVYLWGAQLETGSVSTSYIPTSGGNAAARTRAADDLVISGSDFSDFYNQSEGTLYVEYEPRFTNVTNSALFFFSDGGSQNRIFSLVHPSYNLFIATSDVIVAQFGGGTPQANTLNRVAATFKANDARLSLNGANEVTDTSLTMPSLNQLHIGQRTTLIHQLNGHIKRLIYWPLHSDSL